ncbi:seipin-like [Argiope bruennichi]|uniref:seipin-like n=1 Tax=Argiope bruennichi TaxID=94029 RepID=UPI002495634A|nr:seipin-like [Argiope bruennichi]
MEIISDIKRVIFKFLLIIFACCIVLWFSIFSYIFLYYLYIPAVAHVKPIHLKYDTSCLKGSICSFPYDNLTLVEPGHYELLSGGQAYSIEIDLHMPESERNLNQGMFMIRLDMVSKQGDILQSSRRPAILHYRSPLFKTIYTLFFVPALLAGSLEEKQSFSVALFEKYVENCNNPTHYAYVAIEAETAEIYSCSLKIHAQFTGLRYMMYYWPYLSATVGIGTNFVLISIIIVFIYVRQIMNEPQYVNLEQLSEREQDLVHEIRQSVQKDQAAKASKMQVQARGPGITRKRDVSPSDQQDSEEIENLSSRPGTSSKISKQEEEVGESGTLQDLSSKRTEDCSSGESEFSVCSQEEQFPEEIDNIINFGQNLGSSGETSPVLRRRMATESEI